MTGHKSVEELLEQVAELPGDAQTEMLQSLIAMRADQLGVYEHNDDDR